MGESLKKWKVLLVHPSGLMYSEVYLRLEPLGLELIAEACRRCGFAVRLLDLQASGHKDYFRTMEEWRPDAVGFSLNYLANVPEVIDLAKAKHSARRNGSATKSLLASLLPFHNRGKGSSPQLILIYTARGKCISKGGAAFGIVDLLRAMHLTETAGAGRGHQ